VDAVELLKTDHRTVDRLFERYESMGESASGDRKETVQAIIRELSIHASVEEEILYPTVREALPEGDPMAEEALGEHQEVKEVLADLDRMDPAEPTFDSKVRSLIGDVRHHVAEEEAEMLPRLSLAISKAELEEFGTEDGGREEYGAHPTAPPRSSRASRQPPGWAGGGGGGPGSRRRLRSNHEGATRRPTGREGSIEPTEQSEAPGRGEGFGRGSDPRHRGSERWLAGRGPRSPGAGQGRSQAGCSPSGPGSREAAIGPTRHPQGRRSGPGRARVLRCR
jgi:hemerythrin superfamily protein